jgi:hypothetical protein
MRRIRGDKVWSNIEQDPRLKERVAAKAVCRLCVVRYVVYTKAE